jgi:hypothetical protein
LFRGLFHLRAPRITAEQHRPNKHYQADNVFQEVITTASTIVLFAILGLSAFALTGFVLRLKAFYLPVERCRAVISQVKLK